MQSTTSFTASRLFLPTVMAGWLLFLAPALSVAQTAASWNAPLSGAWTSTSAWSIAPLYPNQGSPSPTDNYDVTIAATGSAYNVTLDSNITVRTLLLNSPDLTLVHPAGNLAGQGSVALSAGTYQYTGSGTGTLSTPAFFSGGTIDVRSGTLQVDMPYSGLTTLGNGAAVVGTGFATFRPGRTYFSGSVSIYGDLSLNAGTMSGSGQLHVWGNVLDNTRLLENSPSLEMTIHPGASWNALRGFVGTFTMNNHGTVEVPAGQIFCPATFTNASDGVVNINTATLGSLTGTRSTNLGTIHFAGTGTIGGVATNHGAMHVSDGGTLVVGPLSTLRNEGSIGGRLRVDGTLLFGGNSSAGEVMGQRSRVLQGAAAYVGSIRQSTITIESGAKLTIDPGDGAAVSGSAFSLALAGGPGAWTSTLDLTTTDFVIPFSADPTARMAVLRDQLHSGYSASPRWTGTGITSSAAAADSTMAIGYRQGASMFGSGTGIFSGQVIGASAIAMKYTFAGDADLDGIVNIADLARLATHWQQPGIWDGGDFNYDGFIDIADLSILASNWQSGTAVSALGIALEHFGLPAVSVPEPVAAGAVIAMTSLIRHRRNAKAPLESTI